MDRDQIKTKDTEYIVHTYNRYDIVADHAEGAVITDVNGKEYVDLCSGYGANSLGYQNEAWLEAVTGQLKRPVQGLVCQFRRRGQRGGVQDCKKVRQHACGS